MKTRVISYIEATYRRSGLQALQRFNNAARHFDTAVAITQQMAALDVLASALHLAWSALTM